MEHKRPLITKEILRKNNKAGGITLPDSRYTIKLQSLKQYGTGIKTNRPMEWNQEPGNKPKHTWST